MPPFCDRGRAISIIHIDAIPTAGEFVAVPLQVLFADVVERTNNAAPQQCEVALCCPSRECRLARIRQHMRHHFVTTIKFRPNAAISRPHVCNDQRFPVHTLTY
jgi:hypothetical protein